MGKVKFLFSIFTFSTLCSLGMGLAQGAHLESDASAEIAEAWVPEVDVGVNEIPRIYDRLNASQKAAIQTGQYLEFTKFFQGEVWPQIIVLQKVSTTPEEAIAVLADFDSHSQYIYRVASSQAYRTQDPAVIVVDYRMNLSSLASSFFDPQYRVQNRLMKGEDGTYQIVWNMVSSRDIKRMEGRATFEALPGGGTLIYYSTFMTPRLEGRNFIVKKALGSQKVVDSVVRGGWKALNSIVAHIENLKATQPDGLARYVEHLRNILR